MEMVEDQYLIAKKLEGALLASLARELEMDSLSLHEKEFLLSVWVHFFSHSALAIWHEEGINTGHYVPNYQNVPADTAAFLGVNRSPEYANYLRTSLSKPSNNTVLNLERQNRIIDARRMAGIQVMLYKPGFSKTFRILLGLASFWKIRSCRRSIKIAEAPRNQDKRNLLAGVLSSALSEFSCAKWLAARAVEFLPAIFLEDYFQIACYYRDNENKVERIFSRDCWSSDDSLKMYSVLAFKSGGKKIIRIGSPHAFNYGALRDFWLRDFETKYLDKYLTWGWSYKNTEPFYITQFSGMTRPEQPKRLNDHFEILITGASRPSHLIEYPYTAESFSRYLERQIQLADELANKTLLKVTIRTRQKERGRELENKIRAMGINSFKFEYQGDKFINRVKNCLHISDNISTTVIETFWLNHPTLLMIEPGYFEIWENSVEEFEALRKVGVFHSSRQSVIEFLMSNRNKINDWWGAPETQKAVTLFLEKHGRPDGSIRNWKSILFGENK